MSQFIVSYADATAPKFSFKQASIYLDACFLLAFLDLSDSRSAAVANMIHKWKTDGISKIGISNHVYAEVVHNLFKKQIIDLFFLVDKTDKGIPLTAGEAHQLGNIGLARQIIKLAGAGKVARFVAGDNRVFFNVAEITKTLKRSRNYTLQFRQHLAHHYTVAESRFFKLVQGLAGLGFHIEYPNSCNSVLPLARSHIRTYQLDAYDAVHLAIARFNRYDYLATLDSDFESTSYIPNVKNTKILKVA